ncbi:nitric-oxide synthase bacterial [Profundibacterium mesophilum KAUST100406-0324]|uniref:Bcr/CflA family efflux transporter n=2 Tax=Profundibacterium TaxID=1258570 RepID=A0A921TC67_9RHOB|nr:nitric-oxide synthase bacterial [Profundibacterium mesophilum KAUST100406-0324]
MATLFATVAFSIDAMLPALPALAADLAPRDANRAQLVLTAFVLGMGIGTLFAGPISDAIGRKRAISLGIALYCIASVLAVLATSLEMLLVARLLQGLGAAGPRIVSLALVRDLYEGRRMAQIMSFVMMIFVLIPAVAPFIGSLVVPYFGWRGIFGLFVLLGLVNLVWLNLRQPETLPPEARRPLRAAALRSALREVLSHKAVRLYILVMALGYGQMFGYLSSVQQIYAEVFGITDDFPLWFMAMALLSGLGTITNAALVMRLGMRRITLAAYGGQAVISAALLLLTLAGFGGAGSFPVFFAWSVSIFLMAGLTFGNLNALALQPLGHVAGMASSVTGSIATVLAVFIAAPIGLAFDGTPLPMVVGTLTCSGLALCLMLRTRALTP